MIHLNQKHYLSLLILSFFFKWHKSKFRVCIHRHISVCFTRISILHSFLWFIDSNCRRKLQQHIRTGGSGRSRERERENCTRKMGKLQYLNWFIGGIFVEVNTCKYMFCRSTLGTCICICILCFISAYILIALKFHSPVSSLCFTALPISYTRLQNIHLLHFRCIFKHTKSYIIWFIFNKVLVFYERLRTKREKTSFKCVYNYIMFSSMWILFTIPGKIHAWCVECDAHPSDNLASDHITTGILKLKSYR